MVEVDSWHLRMIQDKLAAPHAVALDFCLRRATCASAVTVLAVLVSACGSGMGKVWSCGQAAPHDADRSARRTSSSTGSWLGSRDHFSRRLACSRLR